MVVATILSSIATTAAVVVAIYQYAVARDQLVAADRNRTIQTMTDHARALCAMLAEISITKSVLSVHDRPKPDTLLDELALEARIKTIVTSVSNAEKEGRLYYDAEKVRARTITDKFRADYASAYNDFSSATQTVRLWIDDDDSESLRRLTAPALSFLYPNSALPDMSTDDTVDRTMLASGIFAKMQEIQFETYQAAQGVCQNLESRIVDWAKGKNVKNNSLNILPVLTAEEAEKKFKEEGKLPAIRFDVFAGAEE
jgi:hypothetical protein